VLKEPAIFDFAIGGITITDARKSQMDMSDGYLKNGKTILCRKEDAQKYQTLDDLNRPEVRVMINPGGLNEKFARENLTQATLIVYEKNEEICEDIEENESVVVLNKDATQSELISQLAGEKCRSVIISTGDDVANLFIVLAIRESNPDAWIVSRASKEENYSRLRKAGADKIVSPELIGGKDLYLESTRPHILKITIRHGVDEIYDEFKIISKHGCTLENIQYHLPGIETPLTRKINTMNIEDGKQFWNHLDKNPDQKDAIENLYKIVSNVHSHIISGPDRATFQKLVDELEKKFEIIGINLTKKEIVKLTKKNIK
jgi:voltage-gated potassium channel